MQSPDFFPSLAASGLDYYSLSPLLLPVGIAAGAGNYFRDTFLTNSQDLSVNSAIAHINDPTYIRDQAYDEGQNLVNNFDTPTAAYSPLAGVREYTSRAVASAAAAVADVISSTGDTVKSAFGFSMLPGWVKTGFTGGGDSTKATDAAPSLPLWIKTAIVLSLIVGTAVLVKKEIS